MSFRRLYPVIAIVSLPILTNLITSCEKFKGDQTVPAYISIDSIYLSASSSQGTSSASVVDAWVYVDDGLAGAFQLPAKFPVLFRGTHDLDILPGIKVNGIAATRTSYPFFSQISQSADLAEGGTTSLGVLKTTYLSSTQFDLVEGFEGVAISFDTTPRSDVSLALTEPGSPLTFEGNHSAMVTMDSVSLFFECVNDKDFDIPFAPVFLEMNFRTNNVFVAGIFLYGVSVIQQVPVVYLNPTGDAWKKIYIDLTNSLNAYTGMQKFRVFISAIQSSQETETLLLFDNIKVVTRKSE